MVALWLDCLRPSLPVFPSHHVDQNVQLEKQPPQTNKPTTPPPKQKKQGVKFFQRIDSKSCRILDLHLHSWDPFGGIPISRAHRNLPLPKKNCVIVLCMNPPTAIANHPASVENGLQDEDISRVNCVFFLCLPVESGKKGKKCRWIIWRRKTRRRRKFWENGNWQ